MILRNGAVWEKQNSYNFLFNTLNVNSTLQFDKLNISYWTLHILSKPVYYFNKYYINILDRYKTMLFKELCLLKVVYYGLLM